MLSFAGVPLVLPPEDLQREIERDLDPAEMVVWLSRTWPGRDVADLGWRGAFPDLPFQFNVYRHPVGASRWSYIHTLTDEVGLASIRTALKATPGTPKGKLEINDGKRKLETNLFMLPARPIYRVARGVAGLYLLTLVDERYFWWLKRWDGTNPLTWDEWYTTLATTLGITLETDTVDADYFDPHPALNVKDRPLPILMDAVAYSVGQRVVRLLDGTYYAMNALASYNRHTENQRKEADTANPLRNLRLSGFEVDLDRLAENDLDKLVPANVSVLFPRNIDGTDQGKEVEYQVQVSLESLQLPEFSQVTPITGTLKTFHSTCPGYVNETTETPRNLEDLTFLAERIATDYYYWLLGRADARYEGVNLWTPDGHAELIEWEHASDRISTRVHRGPYQDHLEDLFHTIEDAPCGYCIYQWNGAWEFVQDRCTQIGEEDCYCSQPDITGESLGLSEGEYYRAACNTTTPVPCVGTCIWEWDNTAKEWSVFSQGCDSCSCLYPIYCGSYTCERTTTYCSTLRNIPPLCEGTTTTTTTTVDPTSTTTTYGPGACAGSCKWQYYPEFVNGSGAWILQSGDCPVRGTNPYVCACLTPGQSGNCGDVTYTDCLEYRPPPPDGEDTPSTCFGGCKWYFSPDLQWHCVGCSRGGTAGGDCVFCCTFVKGTDFVEGMTCECTKPSAPGVPCSTVVTPCGMGNSDSPTTFPPTSTTRPVGCTGECVWNWNGTTWTLRSTNCPTSLCGCYTLPFYDGTSTCDSAITPCSPTTTSTSTTSTTTSTTCAPTTTAAPSCGTCQFQWVPSSTGVSGTWQRISNSCTGGCLCDPPCDTDPGNTGCDRIRTRPCQTPCTTTTCSPVLPPSCVYPPNICPCGYYTVKSVPDCFTAGCQKYKWVLHANNCHSGGTVATYTGCNDGNQAYVTRECTCPTTTTTSTSTTVGPCGNCQWMYSEIGARWYVWTSACTGACGCYTPPTGTAPPAVAYTVACGTTTTSTSTSTSTSTTTSGPCGGCYWKWNVYGWYLYQFDCTYGSGCACVTPTGSGSPAMTYYYLCEPTTSTSTTSTSTTPAPTCGTCIYTCNVFIPRWTRYSNNCTGTCGCIPPTIPCLATWENQVLYTTTSCSGGTTTPAPTTTTTTTAAPLWYCWLGVCQTATVSGTGYASQALCQASEPACAPPPP